MTEAQEDIDLLSSLLEKEVWLYVNPLKGTHAKLKASPESIAVFKNESIGRSFEVKSEILKKMIGYYVLWDEMVGIANKECQGRFIYYEFPDN